MSLLDKSLDDLISSKASRGGGGKGRRGKGAGRQAGGGGKGWRQRSRARDDFDDGYQPYRGGGKGGGGKGTRQSRSVLLSDLPRGWSDDDILQVLETVGEVDRLTMHDGYQSAVAQYRTSGDAYAAVEDLNGAKLGQKVIRVRLATNEKGKGGLGPRPSSQSTLGTPPGHYLGQTFNWGRAVENWQQRQAMGLAPPPPASRDGGGWSDRNWTRSGGTRGGGGSRGGGGGGARGDKSKETLDSQLDRYIGQ